VETATVQIDLVRRDGATQAQLVEFGRYAATRNADPRQHIGYVGAEPHEVAADFRDLEGDYAFAVAREGSRLCGLLGAEWDLDIGRTWLYGPWTDTPELADRLFDAVRPLVPAGAAQFEVFCDAANTAAVAFAGRHGLPPHAEHVVLRFPRERLGQLTPAPLPRLARQWHDQFAALHDRVFPDTYAPSRVLLAQNPPILVAVEGSTLLGYVTLKLRPEFAEAQIEYVAVAESARGRGVGARLVSAALHEAFADDRYAVMDLVTNNPTARRLYEKVGFTLLRQMRSFRTG
jgi:ribosomal protein S18 acetylase RimI-like enzyme